MSIYLNSVLFLDKESNVNVKIFKINIETYIALYINDIKFMDTNNNELNNYGTTTTIIK